MIERDRIPVVFKRTYYNLKKDDWNINCDPVIKVIKSSRDLIDLRSIALIIEMNIHDGCSDLCHLITDRAKYSIVRLDINGYDLFGRVANNGLIDASHFRSSLEHEMRTKNQHVTLDYFQELASIFKIT